MKCPVCNREMQEGVVQSGRTIFFTTKPHKFFFAPDIAVNDEITLSKHNWTRPTCKAYHCEKCKKVILDYVDALGYRIGTNGAQEIEMYNHGAGLAYAYVPVEKK